VADTIYWTGAYDYAIRGAPLAGGTVDTLYDSPPTSPQDVNLPMGLAIDPTAGRIYWANYGDSTIRGAPLTAGGTVDELYGPADGVSDPFGVAIDPAAGRIYFSHWNHPFDGRIRGAPLAGGGPVDTLYDSARGVSFPGGLAIDPNPAGAVLERLEVADRFDLGGWARGAWDRIRDVFSRDVSPTPSPPPRLYWGNGGVFLGSPHDKKVQSAPLAGTGPVDTLYGSATWIGGPSALAVLRAPVGTGPPVISLSFALPDEFTVTGGPGGGPGAGPGGEPGGHQSGWQFGGGSSGPAGQRLTCSRGSWAPDLLGAFLYRAPESYSYQWRLNGNDIAGANGSQYTATTPGSYSCRVTATNRAGSASQTSAAMAVA
jgi:hypothetical protein